MLSEALEKWRLKQHFRFVLYVLHKHELVHETTELHQQRAIQLQRLEDYTNSGVFPRNHSKSLYTPCFMR